MYSVHKFCKHEKCTLNNEIAVRAIKNWFLIIYKGNLAIKNKLTEIIKSHFIRIQLNYWDWFQKVVAEILTTKF